MYLVQLRTAARRFRLGVSEPVSLDVGRELVAADAAPLVLTILCEGESSGYPIVRGIRERSNEQLEWTDGVAYPLLQRLSRLGYVSAEWRTLLEGRARRYYAITDQGRAALAKARPHRFEETGAIVRDSPQRWLRAPVSPLHGGWSCRCALQPAGAAR